jgi:hypothetical protein
MTQLTTQSVITITPMLSQGVSYYTNTPLSLSYYFRIFVIIDPRFDVDAALLSFNLSPITLLPINSTSGQSPDESQISPHKYSSEYKTFIFRKIVSYFSLVLDNSKTYWSQPFNSIEQEYEQLNHNQSQFNFSYTVPIFPSITNSNIYQATTVTRYQPLNYISSRQILFPKTFPGFFYFGELAMIAHRFPQLHKYPNSSSLKLTNLTYTKSFLTLCFDFHLKSYTPCYSSPNSHDLNHNFFHRKVVSNGIKYQQSILCLDFTTYIWPAEYCQPEIFPFVPKYTSLFLPFNPQLDTPIDTLIKSCNATSSSLNNIQDQHSAINSSLALSERSIQKIVSIANQCRYHLIHLPFHILPLNCLILHQTFSFHKCIGDLDPQIFHSLS